MSDDLFGGENGPPAAETRKGRPEPQRLRFTPPSTDWPGWDATMTPNPGYCPAECIKEGTRIEVQLADGRKPDMRPVTSTSPGGWAASGKGAVRWTLTGHPFDIARYRVIR